MGIAMEAAFPPFAAPQRHLSIAAPYRVAAGICGLMAGFCVLAFLASPLTHDWASLGPVWAAIGGLVVAGAAIEHRGSAMIGRFIQSAGLFFALSLLALLVGALLASTNAPLADAALARWDALLRFDWLSGFSYWRDRAGVFALLSVVYATLSWQPVLLLGLLAAFGETGHAGRFLAAWGIALAICMAVFPFAPAHGNFLRHAIDPASVPGIMVPAGWEFAGPFDALRSGAVTRIDRAMLEGVVTFPSFHTAAAILLAAGFAPLRRLALPMCLLNAAMVVSAVYIGAHYLVDILAGIAVALIALILAQRLVSEGFDDHQHHDQRQQDRRDFAEQL